LVVFTLLYAATAQRGASWQDFGMFQWRVLHDDYAGQLGLALAHPLYIAIGQIAKLIPVGDFCTRLTLLSGLGMAVALANLACILALITGRRWIGFATAAMLSVAHAVWWMSTVAKHFTWVTAGLTLEIWLLLALLRRPAWWRVTLLALVSGLGWSMHNLALLPLPVYGIVAIALVARRRMPAWSLATAAGAFLAGAGLYLSMIVEEAFRSGDLAAAIRSALFGVRYAEQVLNVAGVSDHFRENVGLAALSFASFLLPLTIVGWFHFRRRLGGAAAAAVGAITAVEFLFVARYPVPDQFTFLVPALALFALAAGVGVSVLADRSRGWRNAAVAACVLSVAIPPALYAAGPRLAEVAGLHVQRYRQPLRDEFRYMIVPWKQNEDSAERFADAALREAAPSGVILADSTPIHPLLLVQERDGLAPDVRVEFRSQPLPPYDQDPSAFRAALDSRPLYAVSIAPDRLPAKLLKDAEFSRENGETLYRLVRWKTTATAPGK
jgi:hypothetical protein